MAPRASAPLLVVLVALVAATGCASVRWEETRRDVVDPLNELVHSLYAKAFLARDVEALRRLHVPAEAASPELRARLVEDERLIEAFVQVERARSVIRDASRPDASGVATVLCHFRLDGVDAAGDRVTLTQDRRLRCGPGADGRWVIEDVELLDERRVARDRPAFTEEAVARGIAFRHRSRGAPARDGTTWKFYPGSGLALGDVDGDRIDDVLFVGGAELRLYRNRGDGTFEDITAAAGLVPPVGGEMRCATFADFDDDGDADLFVGVMDGANILWANDGAGRFEDVTAQSGLTATGETMGALVADFDLDGRLDLFVVNCDDLLQKDPEPIYDARNARENQLFLGRDGLRFRETTRTSGADRRGWSQAGSVADYDGDGDPDIFVACDFGFSALLRNRGDGTFEDVTEEAGVDLRTAGMSAAWGDVDGDGDLDLFEGGMRSNTVWIIDQAGFPLPGPSLLMPLIRPYVIETIKEMMYGNRFYRNRGDGTFEHATEAAGLITSDWAFSGVFLDYDNDGRLDIYSSTGFFSGPDHDDL